MGLHTKAAPEQPIDITLDEAKELLERAVKEKGGGHRFTKPDCVYFDPKGCPACLIGYVLHYKGVTLDDLYRSKVNSDANVDTLVYSGVIRADLETLALLKIAQSEQDDGMTWRGAVDEALSTYEESAAEELRLADEYHYNY